MKSEKTGFTVGSPNINIFYKTNSKASLWELTYDVGDNKTWLSDNPDQCKLIKNLDIEKSGNIEIINTNKGYDIVYNGDIIHNLPETQDSKNANSIGFISDHYNHGCEKHGHFVVSDMTVFVNR